jgi:putative nucleotidyltransferase with HDIG domain
MPANDQRHALDVLGALMREGYREPALLQAALLHDVGKVGTGLRLWHRVGIVLLSAGMPALLDRLGRDEPGSWRYPFFAHRHHAQRGAELARQAGCAPLTITLIQQHHDPVPEDQRETPEGRLLLALQAADGHR